MTSGSVTTLVAVALWIWAVRQYIIASFAWRDTNSCLRTLHCTVYPLAAIRFMTAADTAPLDVTSAKAIGHPSDPERIDRVMHIIYAFPNSDVTAEVDTDSSAPGWGPFGLLPRMLRIDITIKLEGGEVFIYNFVLPSAFHFIRVKPKKGPGRFERVYTFKEGKGEKSWSTSVLQPLACRGRDSWMS